MFTHKIFFLVVDSYIYFIKVNQEIFNFERINLCIMRSFSGVVSTYLYKMQNLLTSCFYKQDGNLEVYRSYFHQIVG